MAPTSHRRPSWTEDKTVIPRGRRGAVRAKRRWRASLSDMLPVVGVAVLGLFTSQVALLVTSVYLHRCLSHRALALSPPARGVGRALIWVMTGMRPRQWVAVHRKHHAFTDTERDPHSPLVLGFPRVQFANALLYRKVARDSAAVARYARDVPVDRWDSALFDHALLGLGLGVALLVLLVGLGACARRRHSPRRLLPARRRGDQRHWPPLGPATSDNLATNNQWLAWLVVGEGLHNNHHAAATSSRFSFANGEVDPGWWCIRLLVLMRCATLREPGSVPRTVAMR